MKKLFGFIFLLPLFLLNANAQELFYYTFEDKKPLKINHESFSVIFDQEISWQKFVRTSHPEVEKIHGFRTVATSRIIFELKDETSKSLEDLVQEIFVNPGIVKDVAWGFHINPELPVWLTDNLLYEPSDNWNDEIAQEVLAKYPGASIELNEFGLFSINVSKLTHSLELGNELVEKKLVNWAQPDFMGGYTLYHTPVDPKYDKQYSFHNTGQSIDGTAGTADIDINAPEAWDLSFGSSSIVVGILDEGVEDHEDLVDDMGNTRLLPGYSAAGLGNGESQFQYEGHGVSVAGLISATHNTLGIAGVAPNVQLVSAYVTADPTTVVSNVANSLAWLWQTANVDIINNSYGFKSCDPNLYPSIVSAIDDAQLLGRGGLGCVVIYASGENASGTTCVNFPGNRYNVITVGAVDNMGVVPFYSPFGPTMDVVVPSAGSNSNVRSIDRMDMETNFPDRIGLNIGNYLDFFGGTSSSCAIASGVAALILSEDPNLDYSDVETIMNSTAMDLGSPGKNDSTGNGVLRADAAVSMAMGGFPVEWLDFKGELVNDGINLSWLTATEQNNSFFEVQRSAGGQFMSLGTIPGAGTSSTVNSYSFRDEDPLLGTNYYRIKQVDINGSFSYSAVVEINREQVNSLAISDVYPNPSKDKVHIDFALPRGIKASYQIVDLQGRTLISDKLIEGEGIQKLSIEVADFSPGIYVLVMRSNRGKVLSNRFMVAP